MEIIPDIKKLYKKIIKSVRMKIKTKTKINCFKSLLIDTTPCKSFSTDYFNTLNQLNP